MIGFGRVAGMDERSVLICSWEPAEVIVERVVFLDDDNNVPEGAGCAIDCAWGIDYCRFAGDPLNVALLITYAESLAK
jgi:hypothetical protein